MIRREKNHKYWHKDRKGTIIPLVKATIPSAEIFFRRMHLIAGPSQQAGDG